VQPNQPYCGNCGYVLTGLTESSKCPECGRPLVEVLTRPGFMNLMGKRWRSKARMFGMPVIDVAFGPSGTERIGKARGVIAIGDRATGLVAIGGIARGVVAFGGMTLGVFTQGGMCIGVITALGGLTIGGMSIGGMAIGLLARGGMAIGAMADGGMAMGYYARGGAAFGVHTIAPGAASTNAVNAFTSMSWFFGPGTPSLGSQAYTAFIVLLPTILVGGFIALLAWWAHERDPGREGA
jgi:hypothetical protein